MKLAAPVLQKRKSHYEEEVRAANLAEERLTDAMYFRKMDRMHQSRGNLYCALLGLALRRGVAKGLLGRALWLAVGAVALLGGDIPLCRAHYAPHFCEQFCEQARALAEERLATIRRVRDWHPLGRVAAEVFDDTRGKSEGARRERKGREKRSYDQAFLQAVRILSVPVSVIRRSDASNMLVNCFCVALGGLLVVVAFSAFSEALSDSGMVPAEEGEPPTVPGVPAVNRKAD
ncbi:unnamed protein product [Prorocentrum cordatum]|uniref:Uncharacterized protein n=1 Tax=Prorocentrum cordatum TaxID=2364126 RepID=A0ABN9PJT1_9DINO|nr:unnamed protein product [Polarella glacialis]